jgi:hypothetical protein
METEGLRGEVVGVGLNIGIVEVRVLRFQVDGSGVVIDEGFGGEGSGVGPFNGFFFIGIGFDDGALSALDGAREVGADVERAVGSRVLNGYGERPARM